MLILNIVSIFYMDRANNSLDDKTEFMGTLILPIFVAMFAVKFGKPFTKRKTRWSVFLLAVGGPIVFFVHVAATL